MGTAITTLVRKADHAPAVKINFRHLWGQTKREQLTVTADKEPDSLYSIVEPSLSLGLPFARIAVSDDWSRWPSLQDLLPASFPGVTTSRDAFLVDIDLDRLKERVTDYFNPELGHEEINVRHPAVMSAVQGFDPTQVRKRARGSWGSYRAGLCPVYLSSFSIRAGSTGKRIQSSLTQSEPSTSHTCSKATFG